MGSINHDGGSSVGAESMRMLLRALDLLPHEYAIPQPVLIKRFQKHIEGELDTEFKILLLSGPEMLLAATCCLLMIKQQPSSDATRARGLLKLLEDNFLEERLKKFLLQVRPVGDSEPLVYPLS